VNNGLLPPGQQVAIGRYNKYGVPRIYMNAFMICRWQFCWWQILEFFGVQFEQRLEPELQQWQPEQQQ